MAGWLTIEQSEALDRVAQAFGWDHEPTDRLGMILWCLFHYYASRL